MDSPGLRTPLYFAVRNWSVRIQRGTYLARERAAPTPPFEDQGAWPWRVSRVLAVSWRLQQRPWCVAPGPCGLAVGYVIHANIPLI